MEYFYLVILVHLLKEYLFYLCSSHTVTLKLLPNATVFTLHLCVIQKNVPARVLSVTVLRKLVSASHTKMLLGFF